MAEMVNLARGGGAALASDEAAVLAARASTEEPGATAEKVNAR